jgi:hypothetical protein
MRNCKFLNLAFVALALTFATALTEQLAFADAADAILRPSSQHGWCGSISFGDPSCAAYVSPSPKTESMASARVVVPGSSPAYCGSMSFNDPNCSAYVRTAPRTEPLPFGHADAAGAFCGIIRNTNTIC